MSEPQSTAGHSFSNGSFAEFVSGGLVLEVGSRLARDAAERVVVEEVRQSETERGAATARSVS